MDITKDGKHSCTNMRHEANLSRYNSYMGHEAYQKDQSGTGHHMRHEASHTPRSYSADFGHKDNFAIPISYGDSALTETIATMQQEHKCITYSNQYRSLVAYANTVFNY